MTWRRRLQFFALIDRLILSLSVSLTEKSRCQAISHSAGDTFSKSITQKYHPGDTFSKSITQKYHPRVILFQKYHPTHKYDMYDPAQQRYAARVRMRPDYVVQ